MASKEWSVELKFFYYKQDDNAIDENSDYF